MHEQDNQKIGPKDGKLVTFVDEDVINTYIRDANFNVATADTYWTKTARYGAEVRKAWDAKLAKGPAVVPEEAENGSITGPKLMGLADDIAAGKIAEGAAVETARATIAAAGMASASVGR